MQNFIPIITMGMTVNLIHCDHTASERSAYGISQLTGQTPSVREARADTKAEATENAGH